VYGPQTPFPKHASIAAPKKRKSKRIRLNANNHHHKPTSELRTMKKNYSPLSKSDLEHGILAEFKWTISRGRDTYGYNICTLYINGEKVSSCSGGGYDMQGTALGDWIEMQFPEELKTLEAGTSRVVKTKRGEYQERSGFGGLFFFVQGEKYGSRSRWIEGAKIRVDGGCGICCMEDILKALGYYLRYIPTKSKNNAQYILEPVKTEAH
jgi:hypothetical protein